MWKVLGGAAVSSRRNRRNEGCSEESCFEGASQAPSKALPGGAVNLEHIVAWLVPITAVYLWVVTATFKKLDPKFMYRANYVYVALTLAPVLLLGILGQVMQIIGSVLLLWIFFVYLVVLFMNNKESFWKQRVVLLSFLPWMLPTYFIAKDTGPSQAQIAAFLAVFVGGAYTVLLLVLAARIAKERKKSSSSL
jgi:hypothetical protein